MGGRAGGGSRGGSGAGGGAGMDRTGFGNLRYGLGAESKNPAATWKKNVAKYGLGEGKFAKVPKIGAKYNIERVFFGGNANSYSVAFKNPSGKIETHRFTVKTEANKFISEWSKGGVLAAGGPKFK